MAEYTEVGEPLTDLDISERFDQIELAVSSASKALTQSQSILKPTAASSLSPNLKFPVSISPPKMSQNTREQSDHISPNSTELSELSGKLATFGENSEIPPTKILSPTTTAAVDTTEACTEADQTLRTKLEELEAALKAEKELNSINQEKIKDFQISLSAMNDKFVDQVNETAEMAHAKELVESELEDLSRKLFEEANNMVSVEKKYSSQILRKNTILERKIKDLQDLLDSERMQSAELKQCLQFMSEESAQSNLKLSSFENNLNLSPNLQNQNSSSTSPPLVSIFDINMFDDALFISEFNDFVALSNQRNLPKVLSSSFMRHFIAEDVEPCLRFGPRPRVSSKHILDAIAANSLQIENMPLKNDNLSPLDTKNITAVSKDAEGASSTRSSISSFYRPTMSALGSRSALWERISGTIPPNPNGCQTCGKEGSCAYRFRLGLKPNEEWAHIDTSCRDRLVAVCEFYVFIRHLVNGRFSSRPPPDLLAEIMSLRLSLFYARFGLLAHATALDPTLLSSSVSNKPAFAESPQPFFPRADGTFGSNNFSYDGNYSPTFFGSDGTNLSNPLINEMKGDGYDLAQARNRSQSASLAKPNSHQPRSNSSADISTPGLSHNKLHKSSLNAYLSSSLSHGSTSPGLNINTNPNQISANSPISLTPTLAAQKSLHVNSLIIANNSLRINKDLPVSESESQLQEGQPQEQESEFYDSLATDKTVNTTSTPEITDEDKKLNNEKVAFPMTIVDSPTFYSGIL